MQSESKSAHFYAKHVMTLFLHGHLVRAGYSPRAANAPFHCAQRIESGEERSGGYRPVSPYSIHIEGLRSCLRIT